MPWAKSEFVICVTGVAVTGKAAALPVNVAVKRDGEMYIRTSIPYG